MVYRVDPVTDLHLLAAAELDGLAHYKSSIDDTDAHIDKKARKGEEGKGKGKGNKGDKEKEDKGGGGEGGGVDELALKGDEVSVRVKEIKLIVLLRILQKHKVQCSAVQCSPTLSNTCIHFYLKYNPFYLNAVVLLSLVKSCC